MPDELPDEPDAEKNEEDGIEKDRSTDEKSEGFTKKLYCRLLPTHLRPSSFVSTKVEHPNHRF